MYTYSIIIPHKNTPKLLQRCLDSIPKRNDLHVIVVDDNSDPGKVDFDHFPGYDRDDVELIFTKEGKGAGYARNVGLSHTDCEKILFADADDYFNYCVNEILDEYKTDDHDIVFFNRLNVDSRYYTYSSKRDWYGKHFKTYEENPKMGELLFRYEYDPPHCKLIKKSLIDEYKINFEETTNQNDVRFSYMTGHYAKSIKVENRAIYTVTYSPKSIMFTWNNEKIKTRIGVYSRKIAFLKCNHINTSSLYALNTYLLPNIKNNDENLYKECLIIVSQNGLNAQYYDQLTNDYIEKRKRIAQKNRKIRYIKRFANPVISFFKKIL